MTPSQAAKVIGCTPGQVRTLIRTGKIQARMNLVPNPYGGYYYDIKPHEVRRYAKTKTGGWPRGQSRKQGAKR